jgi:hypothetical protein
VNWLPYLGFAALAVVVVVLVSFAALWLRYIVAINYERGGWWRLLVPLAIKTAVLDIALNYTLFALFMCDKPRKGEKTMSQHLERLVYWKNRRGAFCRFIAKYLINPWDKVGGPHIPLPEAQE